MNNSAPREGLRPATSGIKADAVVEQSKAASRGARSRLERESYDNLETPEYRAVLRCSVAAVVE